jgi:hypothetical protein
MNFELVTELEFIEEEKGLFRRNSTVKPIHETLNPLKNVFLLNNI